jgi:hypothetical protein
VWGLGGDDGTTLFKFLDDNCLSSGYPAFTPPIASAGSAGHSGGGGARPLLLVTDAGHDAVHVVDVVGRSHAGYLALPGSIPGPRGVAASASGASCMVAVSAWKEYARGDHAVRVYRGSGAVWEVVRVIAGRGCGAGLGQLHRPYGLRFTRDGCRVCVVDTGNGRASVFRVPDGEFERFVATGLDRSMDVEEVEGGWLVACFDSHTVVLVAGGVGSARGVMPSLGKLPRGRRRSYVGSEEGAFAGPTGLAAVSGLGLVVREQGGARLQVFAIPDAIAMAAMSPYCVAWMGVVARAALRRR